jgi:hypothetical protein
MRRPWWRHEACLVVFGALVAAGIALPSTAVANEGPVEGASDPPAPSPPGPSSAIVDGEQPAASHAAAPAAPATDGEAPRAQPRVAPRIHLPPRDEDDVPSWVRHPGNALTIDLGAFFGGADLASTEDANGNTIGTISLGSGVLFSIGGMVTPLWIGDAAGFGLGAFAGVKYDSLSARNGSVSMSRFPVGATVHLLLHIDDRWWLFLRGGIQKEFGISISGTGDLAASGELEGSLSEFGEGGFYWVAPAGERRLAFVLTFRYGAARDSIPGTSFDASSGGLIFAMHYNFI